MIKNLLLVCLCGQLLLHADMIRQRLHIASATINIVLFYTEWCPPCAKSVSLMNEVAAHYRTDVNPMGIKIDDGIQRQNRLSDIPIAFETLTIRPEEAAQYDVADGIPVFFVLDKNLQIIKRYDGFPNRMLFLRLIKRLQSGYLENGTLPIEKWIDLWEQKRS